MGEIAVTYFTTAYATLCLCLAGGEGGEVVMQKETLLALVEHVVEYLLVELCAEGHCCKSLCLATGEYSRSMRSRHIVGLNPDGAYVGGLASVEADAFIEDATAHSLTLYVMVVALHERSLFFAFLFGK